MQPIQYSSVKISAKDISEYDRDIKVCSVNREDIKEIRLKHGMIGERFFAQSISGIILVALGIMLGLNPLFNMFSKGDYPSTGVVLKPFAFAVPLIFVGIYLVCNLFKQRYFLSVRTESGRRKIIFHGQIHLAKILSFIQTVNTRFGYNIIEDI